MERAIRIIGTVLCSICVLLLLSTHVGATSLWSGRTIQEGSLFVDKPAPALRENDIVVILIEEVTKASADADTEATTDDKIEGSISNWFSIENAAELLNLLRFKALEDDVVAHQNNSSNLPKWGANIKNEFEGEGETTRNNTVVSTIAARVVAVEPNGNLVLEGKRHIKINQEDTVLRVTGVARPKDISKDNTIYSSLMADLRFAIDGKGELSKVNRRGLVSTIIALIR